MIIEHVLSKCEDRKIKKIINSLEVPYCCENFAEYLCTLYKAVEESKSEISIYEASYYKELIGENFISFLVALKMNDLRNRDKDEIIRDLYTRGVYGLNERSLEECFDFIKESNSDDYSHRIIKSYMINALNKVNSSELQIVERNIEQTQKYLVELEEKKKALLKDNVL